MSANKIAIHSHGKKNSIKKKSKQILHEKIDEKIETILIENHDKKESHFANKLIDIF